MASPYLCEMYTTPFPLIFCIQYKNLFIVLILQYTVRLIMYVYIDSTVHCTDNYVCLLFRPIDGVSTYNVVPFEAGQYFNKIQCFCFEEQRLNPGEEVIIDPQNQDLKKC